MSSILEEGLNARPSSNWTLIDNIYRVGQSPEDWPLLLDRLFQQVNSDLSPNTESNTASHLRQALRLNRYIRQQTTELSQGTELLNQLTFPLIIIDQNLRVVFRSRRYSEVLHSTDLFSIDAQTLIPATQKVADTLSDTFDRCSEAAIVTLANEDERSLLAMPLSTPNSDPIIIIAWVRTDQLASQDAAEFAVRFDLTETESQLLECLLSDLSYAEIASDRGISEHTVRSHIKNIFSKVDCHSRTELMHQMLCGPSLLERIAATSSAPYVHSDPQRHDQHLTLHSGSVLGFAEYGNSEDLPVLLGHNIMGSRYQIPVPETELRKQGVRLIIPDRPGVGMSSWGDDTALEDWAEALPQLLDHLGIDRCHIIGNSIGGAFALAAVRAHPERYIRLALASSMAEMPRVSEIDGLNGDIRQITSIAQRSPRLARLLLQFAIKAQPQPYLDRAISMLPRVDQGLFEQQPFYDAALRAVTENMRGGPRSIIRDLLLAARTWNIDFAGIEVPVHCWHGSFDMTSPPEVMDSLIEQLPNCRTWFLQGETHMLMYRHWHTIVACLLDESCAESAQFTAELARPVHSLTSVLRPAAEALNSPG